MNDETTSNETPATAANLQHPRVCGHKRPAEFSALHFSTANRNPLAVGHWCGLPKGHEGAHLCDFCGCSSVNA